MRNGVITPNGDDRFLAKKTNGEPMYNARQDMLMIHVPCVIFWTFAIVFNFLTGNFRYKLGLHKVVGWAAMFALTGVYYTGVRQLFGFRMTFVDNYTSMIALVSSPFFMFDVFCGMLCVTMEKHIPRHRAHMWLALFGTVATGFVASIAIESRKLLFPNLAPHLWGTVEELFFPTVKILCLVPMLLPSWNPHLQLALSWMQGTSTFKARKRRFLWLALAAVNLGITFYLLRSNTRDLKNIFSSNSFSQLMAEQFSVVVKHAQVRA